MLYRGRSWNEEQIRGLFGAIRNRATRRQTNKRANLLMILEAPPGFEPGMEVLQTSALPLGDGAGRNRSVRGYSGRVYRRRQQRVIRQVSEAIIHTIRSERAEASHILAHGAESPTKRDAPDQPAAPISNHGCAEWSGRRSARVTKRTRRGHRPRRSNIGAGNGIRTRDFDLGKVALYH